MYFLLKYSLPHFAEQKLNRNPDVTLMLTHLNMDGEMTTYRIIKLCLHCPGGLNSSVKIKILFGVVFGRLWNHPSPFSSGIFSLFPFSRP